MIVPVLERPDAEAAPGAAAGGADDWADGDPYAATAGLLKRRDGLHLSDSAWAMHLLGLQEACPSPGNVR